MNRKTAPGVKNGRVQKKHNHSLTPNYWNTDLRDIVVDKEKPGPGYKHMISRKDILAFIELLPEWDELSQGLNAILLSQASPFSQGVCHPEGVIQIGAWPTELSITCEPRYFFEHKEIFDELGVEYVKSNKTYRCKFDKRQVKAYLLLHVFLHELGHHHDRITTRKQNYSSRGETYAEQYARKYEHVIWDNYFARFDD
ncbi:MAG: hypothetical protein ACYC1U_01500 [Candidatus Aquicultorales bacterium]